MLTSYSSKQTIFRFNDYPAMKAAFERAITWPLVHDRSNRGYFISLSVKSMGLSEKEAVALADSKIDLGMGFGLGIISGVSFWNILFISTYYIYLTKTSYFINI